MAVNRVVNQSLQVKEMANMSYCRFENTTGDLEDCYNALGDLQDLNDEELSESEKRYAKQLIWLCIAIANNYADWVPSPTLVGSQKNVVLAEDDFDLDALLGEEEE